MPDGVSQVLAATFLESWAARRELRGIPVTRTGVALRRRSPGQEGSIALLCGLAGALTSKLEPGSVVVPEVVGLPDGRRIQCHPGWVAALVSSAEKLGFTPHTGPLLTAPAIVTNAARVRWANQGYVSVDMETGLLAAQGWRVATVRVILDSPARSIAADWERPMRALTQPRLWKELFWMAGAAPRYAALSARVVSCALRGAT